MYPLFIRRGGGLVGAIAMNEIELDSATMAAIALIMIEQWQESQKPPLVMTTPFDVWLRKVMGDVRVIRTEGDRHE